MTISAGTNPQGVSTASAAAGFVIPTMQDVYRARAIIARDLAPTPLLAPAALSERLGCSVFVKCENLQPIGAFKVRGGLYLMSQLSADERARGVVTASTGNHGQSIAFAAQRYGVAATIFVPEEANPRKVDAMRRYGADVVFRGNDFDESRLAAEAWANEHGAYFVQSADEPRLIAGVATCALEMIEAVPDLDVLIVPLGGGSGLAGASLVGKTINPDISIIGVQAAGAPVAYESWRRRELLSFERVETFAEGLATRVAFELPARIFWERVDQIRLVSDREMRQAIVLLLETTSQLAEGAGAAALAAAMQLHDDLAGKRVGLVLSGGNLTVEALAQALREGSPA